jgi:hypothetical protein
MDFEEELSVIRCIRKSVKCLARDWAEQVELGGPRWRFKPTAAV